MEALRRLPLVVDDTYECRIANDLKVLGWKSGAVRTLQRVAEQRPCPFTGAPAQLRNFDRSAMLADHNRSTTGSGAYTRESPMPFHSLLKEIARFEQCEVEVVFATFGTAAKKLNLSQRDT